MVVVENSGDIDEVVAINYAAAIAFLLGIVIMIVSYAVQLGVLRRERRS